MVIREAQFITLAQEGKAEFVKQLAEYLRAHHADTVARFPGGEMPVRSIPEKTLEKLVQGGIERAGSHGISWRSALAAFVVTMFVVAPNFDDDADVREFLSDGDIAPDYRMDTVAERITEEQWQAIRENYQVTAWA